jgi:hypothetical protein
MKRGELAKKKRKGCLTALLVVWAVFMVKVIAVLNPGFPEAWRMVEAGQIAGFAYIWLLVFLVLFCPLAHRPERLLSEKEAGNVPSGWGMGGFDTHA